MDIKNLTGLEKPLTKLIEVVAKGTGILYGPTHIKRIAIAEAEALKIQSEAIKDVLSSHGASGALALVCKQDKLEFKDVSDLANRLKESKNYQEILEQRNTENIIANAIEYIGENATDEDVDVDWRTRFFKKAREVSHEDMQKVWGKVLAGEVEKPGTYSIRSLELLSNLSQYEAELFRKFSSYINLDSGYILIPDRFFRITGLNKEFTYSDLLTLEDCGLLMFNHDVSIKMDFTPNIENTFAYKGGKLKILNQTPNIINQKIDVATLTSSGKELLKLVDNDHWDELYFENLKNRYSNLNLSFTR